MNPFAFAFLFALLLFVSMVLGIELGFWIGRRHIKQTLSQADSGFGVVETSIFALLGLLLAFTFSGAAVRFDERRHLIIEEANIIGSNWKLIDLLPDPDRAAVKKLFREYTESRMKTYQNVRNAEILEAEYHLTEKIENEIWDAALHACEIKKDTPTTNIILPRLTEMFSMALTRKEITRIHTPDVIFFMLFMVALTCSVFAGMRMSEAQKRSWLHIIGFALIISLAVYVILDLENPRSGLIKVTAMDTIFNDLDQSMQ